MAPRLTSQRKSLSAANITRIGCESGRRKSIQSNAPIATPALNAAAVTANATNQPRRRRKCRVTVDITACRYAVIQKCLRERGFRLVKAKEGDAKPKWDIWWSDRGDLLKDLPRLNAFQKINHFPAMEEICRKDFLANNLNAICKVLPDDFDFYPRSFLMPAESVELQKYMEKAPKNVTFIAKPKTLCQGKGISLVQPFSEVPNEPCVVQHYVDNPLLIDGFKFDLRIYVLVFSVHPLRIYIFKNGLACFCTTTTAGDENKGSKRSLAAIMAYLDAMGRYSSHDVWAQICDIVVKTLLCIQPKLSSTYKSFFGESDATWGPKCFEVLGFDIMLDANGKAWLFEVNHAPSFAGGSPLDREIKSVLISSTLALVDVTNEKKRIFLQQNRQQWSKRLWSTQPQIAKKSALAVPSSAGNAPKPKQGKETKLIARSAPHEHPEEGEQDQKVERSSVEQNLAQDDGDDDASGSGDSADELDNQSSDDTDQDDVDGNEEGNQQKDVDTVKLPAIRCIFQKSNRVSPSLPDNGGGMVTAPLVVTQPVLLSPTVQGDAITANTTTFTNEYAQIYPVSQSESHPLIDVYAKIQVAAEVNKSKLWN